MSINEENKALIRKYIDGRCTPTEIAVLKQLMSENDLAALFDEVMDEVAMASNGQHMVPNINEALAKFHQQLEAEQALNQPFLAENEEIRVKKLPIRKYLSYAASILVVFSITAYFILAKPSKSKKTELVYQHFSNPKGKRSKILLPDGSFVYLGAGSALSFPNKFLANTREVDLQGEAFFEVTKNPVKPFIIHTGNVSTRVLGTSFKVDAFAGKAISVLVNTGKVRVDRKVKNKLYSIAVLLPGQFVTWNEQQQAKKTGTLSTTDLEDWKNGKLVFRRASIAEVTTALERWYNVAIRIDNKMLADRMVRVNLTVDIPLNKVMKILSTAGNFHYKINNNQVTIF